MFFGHFFEQYPEEHHPVRHVQDIGIVKVEFKLGISAFCHNVMQVPAHLLQDINQFTQKSHRVERIFHVIAKGLATGANPINRVIIECLDRQPVAIPFHRNEFRFHAGKHRVVVLTRLTDGAL